ncbi:MAG: TOBE domain-containing protein, partial [Lachnospiraceae bacterium]|nr:TOBE domain-containing protein [Lachnospiraceae bacterium]
GALDLKMRKEMQIELKSMHDKLGITFIYVTHDQEEALTMSDKIVVMKGGQIQQIGPPEDIYNEPKNAFVADFIGESNIFKGIMTGKLKVRFCGGEFDCMDDVPEGTQIDAVVRPEDFILTSPVKGTVKGIVTNVVFKGIMTGKMKVRFCGGEFECMDDVPEGTQIDAVVRPEDVILTAPEKGTVKGTVTGVVFKGIHYEITVESGKYEMVIQSTKTPKVGEEVGMCLEPDGIHIMIAEDHTTRFDADINDDYSLEYNEKPIDADITSIIKGSVLKDGVLKDSSGETIRPENIKIHISIEPADIELTDDAEKGLTSGEIINLIYKGDHYSYVIRTSKGHDLIVDDEYLWNLGDIVGLIMPAEKMTFTLAK